MENLLGGIAQVDVQGQGLLCDCSAETHENDEGCHTTRDQQHLFSPSNVMSSV
jgi:hypothetical protein